MIEEGFVRIILSDWGLCLLSLSWRAPELLLTLGWTSFSSVLSPFVASLSIKAEFQEPAGMKLSEGGRCEFDGLVNTFLHLCVFRESFLSRCM